MKKILFRALKDTFRGRVLAGIWAVVGGIISIGILWVWKGRAVAFEETPFVVAGLIGAFGSILLMFLINLLAAPYRIERDGHNETKKLVPEPWNKSFSPSRPSQEKMLADILNRRASFTLRESARLLIDHRLSGKMSDTALAQLQELQEMMRDGEIERVNGQTISEALMSNSAAQMMFALQTGRTHGQLPHSAASVSRKTLYEISIQLNLPIAGLKP